VLFARRVFGNLHENSSSLQVGGVSLLLAIAACVFGLSVNSSRAQDELLDLNCLKPSPPLTFDCTPTVSCQQFANTRDCSVCLLRSPFGGGCLTRGNDPSCEAQKKADNMADSVNKLTCETQKAATKARCEAVKAQLQARASAEKAICIENASYNLFIHAGQSPSPELMLSIKNALAEKGYTVRAEIDSDRNQQFGPGVEYFDDSAATAAANVANIVNGVFTEMNIPRDDNQKLKARRINVTNPPRWLGVWLF
jgi:hypothetical protein